MYEAQEILRWLKNHGIKAVLEGQLTYKMGPHVPNGLGIYILDDSQFQKAKLLLRKFDKRFRKSAPKNITILEKLKAKKLDKLAVAVGTVLLIVFVIWLVLKLIS